GDFSEKNKIYSREVTEEAEAASGILLPPKQEKTNAPASTSSQTNNVQTGRKDNSMPVAGANADAAARRPDGGFRRNRIFGNFVGEGDGAIEPLGSEPDIKRRFLGFNMTAGFIDTTGIGGAQIFRNRLRLREGPGAIDAEHLGGLASGIHSTMLSSDPDTAEGDPVLRIFDRWPKDWDGAFTLLARGGFEVSSSIHEGTV